MTLDSLIERVFSHFTSGPYATEVTGAKEEFFERGMIDEDSQEFEVRMMLFLDWYIFSRPLSKQKVAPIKMANQEIWEEGDKEQMELLTCLASARNSIFEFVKIKNQDLHIKDLIRGEKLEVKNSDIVVGFSKDEFFQSRLIPVNGNFVFTRGFCFHPPEARKYILKEVKALKGSGDDLKEDFLLRLTRMKFKIEQYKHLKVNQVYSNDFKIKY